MPQHLFSSDGEKVDRDIVFGGSKEAVKVFSSNIDYNSESALKFSRY